MATTDTSDFVSILNTLKDAFNSLTPAVSNAVSVFSTVSSLSQGFNSMNASVTALNSAAGLIPINYIKQGATLSVQTLESMRKVSDQMLDVGVGMGDYTKNVNRIAGLGITPEKLKEILTKYPVAMGGVSATAEERAESLTQAMLKAKENHEVRKLIDSSITFNDTMAEAIAYQASLNPSLLTAKDGMEKLANLAFVSAKAWDENARVTGQSREQISQEARERMNSIKSQLFLNQISEEQRVQYGRMLDMTKTLGPATQELVETFARGGRLTKEQIQQLGALGPGGAKLENAVRDMMAAKSPEDKRRAELQLEAAKAAIAREQSSKAYSDLVQQGKGPVAEAAATLAAQNLDRASLAAQLRGMPQGTTVEQAQATRQQRVARESAGYTADGQVDSGQLLGREWSQNIQAGQTQLAAFFSLFDEKIVENIGGTTAALQTLRDTMFGGNLTREQQIERLRNMPGEIERATDTVLGPSTGINTGPAAAAPPTPPPSGSTTPVNSTWFDSFKDFFSFSSGTYGTFGEWFNDFGPEGKIAKLHNNEAVVPFNNLSKFLSDTYESMPHLFQSIITDMESKKTTVTPTGAGKTELPFKFSEVTNIFEKIQQEQQKAFASMPKPSDFTPHDAAAKSLSTPRAKTVINTPFNSADAMSAGLTGKMPQARTDKEDQMYKKWIIGGQIGPDPVEARRKAASKESEVQKILNQGEKGKAYEVSESSAEAMFKSMKAKQSATKSKEGKLVSPELQKILEEGESGKAYEVSGESAEDMFNSMKAKMGKIKTPESERLPSMSDLASKMQEGMPKVEQGLAAAAKAVPEMAGISAPGSLGDVVGMLGKLHGTMSGMATTAKATARDTAATAKYSKKTAKSANLNA